MGVLSRISYVVRSKVNAVLNRAEDPSETLDYSYEQMRDQLQEVKRGIADLTTQKKRLEMQKKRLEENVDKHNRQARQAVEQDRDDLARRALEKKKAKMTQIEELEGQIADLQRTQDQLVDKKETLQQRIEEFRTKKETIKARHEAAEASARVSEAITGAGDEMSDVSRAIERAEERTEDMEARSAALDELEQQGVFEDQLSDKDSIDRELEQVSSDAAVEAELDTLKSEVDGERARETEVETETASGNAGDGGGSTPQPDVGADVDETEVEKELEELKEEEESA
jgi:phage shock protein A